jgi:hypothetical protein
VEDDEDPKMIAKIDAEICIGIPEGGAGWAMIDRQGADR